jgi:hypothetical protein
VSPISLVRAPTSAARALELLPEGHEELPAALLTLAYAELHADGSAERIQELVERGLAETAAHGQPQDVVERQAASRAL